ncbi:MAG: hypothetical protein P0116_07255 [Candidatus Nitrosocosmicus sp.]|nr:hypothetical protein [Candidatus Nitrosocosmicus sp.]
MLNEPTPMLELYLNAALNPSYENVKSVFEQMLGNPTLLNPNIVDAFIKRINLTGEQNTHLNQLLKIYKKAY